MAERDNRRVVLICALIVGVVLLVGLVTDAGRTLFEWLFQGPLDWLASAG